jgi:hypothetical protein
VNGAQYIALSILLLLVLTAAGSLVGGAARIRGRR